MKSTDRWRFPLWHNRDYLLLWSGQTISSIGSGVSELAFPLLVLALTHSPAQAGFASAFRTLPYFIFTLPGGALIDSWNRKRVMILCDTGRAISLASIPVALVLGHLKRFPPCEIIYICKYTKEQNEKH